MQKPVLVVLVVGDHKPLHNQKRVAAEAEVLVSSVRVQAVQAILAVPPRAMAQVVLGVMGDQVVLKVPMEPRPPLVV